MCCAEEPELSKKHAITSTQKIRRLQLDTVDPSFWWLRNRVPISRRVSPTHMVLQLPLNVRQHRTSPIPK